MGSESIKNSLKIEKMYRLEDIAGLLNVSKKTVYNCWNRWKAEGRIKEVYRIGNGWRFPESSVKHLVKSFEI